MDTCLFAKKISLHFFAFCLPLIALLFLPNTVFANDNFETNLNTTYLVSETGLTTVRHVIELKNRQPTVYATQYGLKVSSPNIKNVQVKSNGQALTPAIATTENQTTIGITFPDTLVGENKARRIEVSYQDPDSAVISGKVLEVLVPKLADPREYDSYLLTLNTPASYGKPNRVTPADFSTEESDGRITTIFDLQNGEGVVALFGTQQVFNVELQYHLENSGTNTGLAQIALPPDTSFQKVWYEQLEPQPQTIASDDDGNWIATYQVQPQQTIDVMAIARVLITLDSMKIPMHYQSNQSLLADQEFWPTTHPKIKELAQTYHTPREIYDFAVQTLSYNYQALETDAPRLGAVEALANPELATCKEFTDVFVTLARAAEIPTRRITGYAYTQNNLLRPLEVNSNILHTWPEYFDTQRQEWHPVDPTWGNTTGGVNYFDQFDLNHIAFAINGKSSVLPYPAGSYNTVDADNNRDVAVSFAKNFPHQPPEFELALEPTLIMGVPLPGNYTLQIKNRQGRAWYNTSVIASSSQTVTSLPRSIELPQILPFQTVTIPLHLYSNQLWKGKTSDLQLEISYVDSQDENITNSLRLKPLIITEGGQASRFLSFPGAIPGVVIGSISLALIAGSVLVRGRRR